MTAPERPGPKPRRGGAGRDAGKVGGPDAGPGSGRPDPATQDDVVAPSRSDALARAREAARRNDWLEAARLYHAAGEYLSAATALEKSGSLAEAAEAWQAMGSWADAARCHLKAGNALGAAEAFERADSLEAAAKAYQEAGEPRRAARLLLMLGDAQASLKLYQQAGDASGAAKCLVSLGRWSEAARSHEEAGEWEEAARCLERSGGLERAEELYLKSGDDRAAARVRKRLDAGMPTAPAPGGPESPPPPERAAATPASASAAPPPAPPPAGALRSEPEPSGAPTAASPLERPATLLDETCAPPAHAPEPHAEAELPAGRALPPPAAHPEPQCPARVRRGRKAPPRSERPALEARPPAEAGEARAVRLEGQGLHSEAARAWEGEGMWEAAARCWLRAGSPAAVAAYARVPERAAALDCELLLSCTREAASQAAPRQLRRGGSKLASLSDLAALAELKPSAAEAVVRSEGFAAWASASYPFLDAAGVLADLDAHPAPEPLRRRVLLGMLRGEVACARDTWLCRALWFERERGRPPTRLEAFAMAKVPLASIDAVLAALRQWTEPLGERRLAALPAEEAAALDRASVEAARLSAKDGRPTSLASAFFDLGLDLSLGRRLGPFIASALSSTEPLDPSPLPAPEREALDAASLRLVEATGGDPSGSDLLALSAELGVGVGTLSRARALVSWASAPPSPVALEPARGRDEARCDAILRRAAPSDLAEGHPAVARVALSARCGVLAARRALDHLLAVERSEPASDLSAVPRRSREGVERDLRSCLAAQPLRGDAPRLAEAVCAGVPARRARLALACFSHALASPLDVASLDDGARAELERASMEAAERVLADGRPLSLSSLVLAGGLDLEGARRAWSYCLWAGLAEGGPGRQAP